MDRPGTELALSRMENGPKTASKLDADYLQNRPSGLVAAGVVGSIGDENTAMIKRLKGEDVEWKIDVPDRKGFYLYNDEILAKFVGTGPVEIYKIGENEVAIMAYYYEGEVRTADCRIFTFQNS